MAEVPQSLHAKLRDALRASILQGVLQPGDQLPSESQLQAQHGVSRITVRSALAALQADGLIVKIHGKGAFVSQPRTAQPLNSLQGLNEALATETQQVSNQLLGWTTLAATAPVAAWLGMDAGDTVYQLRTVRYVNRQPLSVNTSWLRPGLGSKLLRVDLSQRDLLEVFEHEGGIHIGRAEVEITAGQASAEDARWLGVKVRAPVLQVVRRVLDTAGVCVHTEHAVHRAETFKYQLTLQR